MKFPTILVCSFLLLGSAKPLPHFHEVVRHSIYRGGVPDAKGLEILRDMGVSTILSIRDENPVSTLIEKRRAENRGFVFISIPISSLMTPDKEDMREIVRILSQPIFYPLYIHCTHGQDRTGLAIGLYRVCTQGWAPERAYTEMWDLGFHTVLFNLRDFFWSNVDCGFTHALW